MGADGRESRLVPYRECALAAEPKHSLVLPPECGLVLSPEYAGHLRRVSASGAVTMRSFRRPSAAGQVTRRADRCGIGQRVA